MPQTSEPLLTGRQVASLLHVHINTVRRWGNNGTLKCYRIGTRGDHRFTKAGVKAFLLKSRSVCDG